MGFAQVTNTRTDNANSSGKKALRMHFLRRYHEGNARVFDCCQGSGLVWGAVRKEFEVQTYFGVDIKAKSGRIAIDSVKIVSQGVNANVIDVDTYGEPWTHWLELLPHVKEPTTVFLTCGKIKIAGMSKRASTYVFGKSLRMPPLLFGKLWDYATAFLLSAPTRMGLEIVETIEAVSKNDTRYIGMHIKPVTDKQS
jgi:hypothetical protein